ASEYLSVTIEAPALIVRALVGIEPEPRHAIDDHAHRLVRRALAVRVLDAQNELAAVAPRVQPAEERRAHAADVQQSRGAGRKARYDGHGAAGTFHIVGARMLPSAAATRLARLHYAGASADFLGLPRQARRR